LLCVTDLDEYIERLEQYFVANGSVGQRRNTTDSRKGGNFSDVGRREDVQAAEESSKSKPTVH